MRTAAHACRRLERESGRFWSAQSCTEMAHPTRFERVIFAFGGQRKATPENSNLRWLHVPATISNCETPVPVAGVFVLREIAKIPARSPRTSILNSSASGVRIISFTSERRISPAFSRVASVSSCNASRSAPTCSR